MKTTIKLLLLALVPAFSSSIGTAQIIYSNSFNGDAVTVNGTAPTSASSLLGGLSGATWTCTTTNGVNATVYGNGTIDFNPGCALLPFTPQPGCVYFMQAGITMPPGMLAWVAMGFAQSAWQTNNATGSYCRFTDNPPGGYAWMGIKADTAQGMYAGRGTGYSMGNTTVIPAGTTNLTIVLNTIGSQWMVSAFLGGTISGTNVVGGTQLGTNFTYGANPPIAYAGIGQTSFSGQSVAGIQWNYWTLSVTQAVTAPVTKNYWAGPSASGTGDGSTPFNTASYLDHTFWSSVQDQLQSANVDVTLENGTYAGTLNFTNIGNPLHQLTLQAASLYQPIFNGSVGTLIYLLGCQNIKLDGIVFSGPASYWGVECLPNYLAPCRNIEFSYCQFLSLTNILYGAIGLVNGARDILVDNCTFTNLTANNGNHQHMLYCSHNIVGVTVTNCLFQDDLADYVRFRDNSDYCTVENSTFISTMSASAWPFVSVELYNETNSDSAGDEFFGTHFQVSGNTFIYRASGGPGPYSSLHFSDYGWSPYTYYCDLTSAQASQLASGGAAYQQSFLQSNMGIDASDVKMFGNTYSSPQSYDRMDYTYEWDNSAPWNSWQGTVNVSGAADPSGASLGPIPVLRNGDFDTQGLMLTPVVSSTPNQCLFQTWFCNPKYATVFRVSGLDGTANALLLNSAQNQYLYQWMTPPGPNWTLDFQFAIGSGFTGTGTKFKVDIFHDDIAGAKISVGVNDQGQFGIYNNVGTFAPLPGLGTVSFSTNNIYRMRIVGDYGASTPYVNIYTSDANSTILDHESANLTDWVNGTPISGQSSPETIAVYNYTAPVIVDQIAFASGLAGQPPVITSAGLKNGQFVLSGTNGFAGDTYYLLSSTNLASGQWMVEAAGDFDTHGHFSVSNTVTPGAPQKFYRLELQ